jgi:hypothetical protein
VISSATGNHDDLRVNRLERQDFDVAPGLFAYDRDGRRFMVDCYGQPK